LGIDPGLRITGYGVIETPARGTGRLELVEAGLVKTPSGETISSRLLTIYESLKEVMSELKPDIIAIEKLYAHYKHPATAILMGHARAMVCLLSGKLNIPLTNLPSTHVKKMITGAGHAKKPQMQRMVQYYLGLKKPPASPDAADALAIAIAYAFEKTKTGRSA
jgi:crossover junction endodeoxyribonuclease RuvC